MGDAMSIGVQLLGLFCDEGIIFQQVFLKMEEFPRWQFNYMLDFPGLGKNLRLLALGYYFHYHLLYLRVRIWECRIRRFQNTL